MTKISEDAFPKGQQGAGMICDATFAPTSVSFAQVEWLEIGKDAINVKGYWEKKKKEGSDLAHHPNPDWVQLNNLNRHGDHAASSGWPPPWEDGSRDWPIPNNFRTVGEAGPGKFFKDTTQAFVITPNGTTTITKAGDHVTRTP